MNRQFRPSIAGRRPKWRNRWVAASAVLATMAMIGMQPATSFGQGAGGTAKPPAKNLAQTRVFPVLAGPTFGGDVNNLHQFDITGFIQGATADGVLDATTSCTGTTPANLGGTL